MSNFNQLLQYIKGKQLLIVGGSPSAANQSKEWYDSFDIIVRLNNYKKINSDRTDIYFSYFGRNIKKTKEELIRDGVKFLINKCPNSDMTCQLKGFKVDMKDYRWIYELRKNWWFCPLISLPEKELLKQIELLGGYMPTVGLSVILFLYSYVKPIHIIGFDCFDSEIHNLNEPWNNSGNHQLENEKAVLTILEKQGDIIWYK